MLQPCGLCVERMRESIKASSVFAFVFVAVPLSRFLMRAECYSMESPY